MGDTLREMLHIVTITFAKRNPVAGKSTTLKASNLIERQSADGLVVARPISK